MNESVLSVGERHLHRSALIDFLGRQRDRFRQDGGVLPCRSGRQYDILGFGFEFFHLDKLRLDLFELPALGHDGNSVGQFDPFDIFQTDIGAFVRILRCDSEADRTCRRRTGRHDDGYLRLSISPPSPGSVEVLSSSLQAAKPSAPTKSAIDANEANRFLIQSMI